MLFHKKERQELPATTKKRKKIISRLINLVLIGLLVLLVVSPDAKAWMLKQFIAAGFFKVNIKEDKVDKTSMPVVFSFRDEKGTLISSESLAGKTVFINFWASWCPPCRAEMPALQNLYNSYRNDKRIVFLFINEDSDPDKAKTFLINKGYDFPIFTSAGEVSQRIFTGTLPTTVILDKKGLLVMKHEGVGNFSGKKFSDELQAIL